MNSLSPNPPELTGNNRLQTPEEEITNAVLHGVGLGMAIAALAVLLVFATKYGDAWHITSFSIYGATLILLYLASTLYHSFPHGNKIKYAFQVLDHSSIFLLIAGTYTPVTLTAMRGPWGWSIFGAVWGIAVVGVIMQIFWLNKLKLISLIMYAVMGWLILIGIKPLIETVNATSLWFLLAGGLSYSIGIYFYSRKAVKYYHAIWHLFVLGGSICHFFTVFFLLIN